MSNEQVAALRQVSLYGLDLLLGGVTLAPDPIFDVDTPWKLSGSHSASGSLYLQLMTFEFPPTATSSLCLVKAPSVPYGARKYLVVTPSWLLAAAMFCVNWLSISAIVGRPSILGCV